VRNNWLRIVHSIAQSGRGTILCGTMLPEDIDRCDHRDRFSQVHYLNLHCEDATRDARLRARPGWRGCTEEFIDQQRTFARWLLDSAAAAFDPPMITVDTTHATVAAVACQIRDWAHERWTTGSGSALRSALCARLGKELSLSRRAPSAERRAPGAKRQWWRSGSYRRST
jgi:hypothetical protein